MRAYIGHDSQIRGVEELRLVGGKGDGMRLFQVRNGKGLEFTVSADRCADITRLSFKGDNYSFISPCGYVAPAYYDDQGVNWLQSFTAGFVTTCGLSAVGNPCVDDGESTSLHGKVGNIPAERIYWDEDEDSIWIKAIIREARIFERKLKLTHEQQAKTLLVEKLAPLADLYIGDAFAAAHRDQPTLCGFEQVLPSAMGRLFEKEYCVISELMESPARPAVFVLGGAKISDAFMMMNTVLSGGVADKVLTGGLVGNILLAAKGEEIGKGSMDFILKSNYGEYIEKAKAIYEVYGDKIVSFINKLLSRPGRFDCDDSDFVDDSDLEEKLAVDCRGYL